MHSACRRSQRSRAIPPTANPGLSMNFRIMMAAASVLCFGAYPTSAQDTDSMAQLKRQLRELQEEFDRTRQQQQQQIETLTKKLDALSNPSSATANAAPQQPAEPSKLEQQLAAELAA